MPARRLLSWITAISLFAGMAIRHQEGAAAAQDGNICAVPVPANPSGPEAAKLLKLRDDGDIADLKAHAWDIFVKELLIAPGNYGPEPIWQDWCAMTDNSGRTLLCQSKQDQLQIQNFGFNNNAVSPAIIEHRNMRFLEGSGFPRQLELLHSGRTAGSSHAFSFQPTGPSDSLLFETSEVLIKPDSLKQIETCFPGRSSNSSAPDLAAWEEIHLGPPTSGCLESNPLPSTSIAIKTVWAITGYSAVELRDSGGSESLSFKVPIWQDGVMTLEQNGGFTSAGDLQSWDTGAQLILGQNKNTSPPPDCKTNASYLFTGHPLTSPPIPISCFYYFSVSNTEWQRYISAHHIVELTASPNVTIDPVYFVLLGFHVTTKEIPNWTWQTFWWNGKAHSDPESPFQKRAGTTGAIDNPKWSHYEAQATYGPPAHPPADYSPNHVFNPYLEGPAPNGTNSNCFTCHNFAIFHKDSANDLSKQGFKLGLGICGANCAKDFCSAGERTDFLWSLANINVPPPNGPSGSTILGADEQAHAFSVFIRGLAAQKAANLKAQKSKTLNK